MTNDNYGVVVFGMKETTGPHAYESDWEDLTLEEARRHMCLALEKAREDLDLRRAEPCVAFVVLDDGDNGWEFLEDYMSEGPEVRFVRREDGFLTKLLVDGEDVLAG